MKEVGKEGERERSKKKGRKKMKLVAYCCKKNLCGRM